MGQTFVVSDPSARSDRVHSQPRPAAPRGFHCEHTPGGSRVLALVDHDSAPSSLHAVLSCRRPELAHEAARLLQRALHVAADAWDAGPLEELCGRLPDEAADSLRTAVGRALAGAWPSNGGDTPEWGPPPERAAPGSPTPLARPDGDGHWLRAPLDARLADLDGPVFRIALLREFHVHDRRALLNAAADEGWEPLPADRLGSHDPEDLIGATLWLAERGGAVAGADTLADRSQAYRLTVEDGDEVAGWSREEVVADFGSGWHRHGKPPRAGLVADLKEVGQHAERPDFAALFEVEAPHCTDPECEQERCRWQLTPRTAAALYEALRRLAGDARDHAEALGDRPLALGGIGEGAGFFTRLPRVTFGADAEWRQRFVRAVEDIGSDLENGWWPEPSCTAEELALHLAIEDARAAVEARAAREGRAPEGGTLEERAATGFPGDVGRPAHRDDDDFDGCAEMFFQDTDVLMLYDAGLDGVEDPEDEVNQRLHIGDLRPSVWFEPFLNVAPRETDDTEPEPDRERRDGGRP
ncbi:hypothetical protein ACFYPN_26090 [Streptomyces sp. NPDC005576]|uniref:hypothetical protein n=1 Tax=Streptomyces sp. NPDC005576 TaxID=3364726 RepID=UPI003677732C